MMDTRTYLNYWAELYKTDMLTNIMPFWLRYGVDKEHGGIYTCVARNGELMDSTKSVWFQGRFAFTCCYAYNNIEARPEWLEAAKSTLDFIEEHCFDRNGRMYFEVAADGTPLRMRRYVFSESFAAIAMAEYALATGDKSYAEKALKIFKDMRRFLQTPGILEPKYLPTVQAQGHSITMILINVASRIKKVIDDPELDEQIDTSLHALKTISSTRNSKPYWKQSVRKENSLTPSMDVPSTRATASKQPGSCWMSPWTVTRTKIS